MIVQLALKAAPKIVHAGWKVLVPLGVGTAAALGVEAKGIVDTAQGRKSRQDAMKRLSEALADCEALRVKTERIAREYGELQIRVHKETVGRLADRLERNEHLVKRLNFKKVDGVRIRIPNIPKYAATLRASALGSAG
ncbi:hypothetical protein [Cryobacterium sp. N21]|uniref:hypothetical protein n=1 Tax=Cryobacterium sp. N21 TaxID=2048289 RepID=UPI001124E048|nr:hypothetical protein [Cryobacterium sp. N21]